MVVPVLPNGDLVLVSQYRYLNGLPSLEFPCGGVKAGHGYEETAVRELAEEAGYSAGSLREIGQFNPYNGVTDEICRVYLAQELAPAFAPPDETEDIERVMLSPEEFEERIRRGEIWDGMTLAAWSLARTHIQH